MLRRDLLKAIPASLFLTGFPNLGATKNLKDGRMVVINLEGGMDGICAVPPLGDKSLRTARRDLLINENLELNPFFGLHPSFKNFGTMLASNEATIIHATAFRIHKGVTLKVKTSLKQAFWIRLVRPVG